jgi:hypothetical protein
LNKDNGCSRRTTLKAFDYGQIMSRSHRSAASRRQSHQTTASTDKAGATWFGNLAPGMLFVLTFVMCCFPLRDFDFWWHLKTGELILERGTVPYADWFTYMDANQPWIDMHWGFQILIVGVYRFLGVNGVILTKAMLFTTAVAIGWIAAGRHLPRAGKVFIWLPAVIAISGRAYERPEMLTVLFLAMALLLAEKCRNNTRWLPAWPLLILVWANCHALFILGIVVWCALAGEALLRQIPMISNLPVTRHWHPISPRQVALYTVLILGAALINPYTLDGLMFPWVLYRKFSVENDFYGVRIGEFRAPVMFLKGLIQQYGPVGGIIQAGWNLYFTSEVAVFLIALASFRGIFTRKHFSPFRLVLFAGFSHLAWVATRNTSIFSLVAAVTACANLQDERRTLRSDEPGRHDESPLGSQLATLGLGLLMVIFISGEWGHVVEKWKVFGFGEAKNWFGHDAAKFSGQQGHPKRAFVAHIGLAATWIYHNGPDKKVFMDPRLEVCSRKTFEQYDRVLAMMATGATGWEQIVNPDHGEMPTVILDSRHSRPQINGMLQRPDWRLVFADQSAAVFLTTTQADALSLKPADPSVLVEIQD